MRSKLRWLVTIVSCLASFVACATGSDDTRIRVIIDADPEIRSLTRSLVVEAYEGLGESLPLRNSGDKSLTRSIVASPTTTGTPSGWPYEVMVPPLGGRRDQRLLVTVQALASRPGEAPDEVVFAQELSRFWPKQIRELRIFLRTACRGVICEETQTCRDGTCQELVEEGLDGGLIDATSDAGMDANRTDAHATDARADSHRSDASDASRNDASTSDASTGDASRNDASTSDATIDSGATTGRLSSTDRSCETLGGSGGVRSDWPARITASLSDPDGAQDLLSTAIAHITPAGRSNYDLEVPVMLIESSDRQRFGARVDIRREDFIAAGSPMNSSFWSVHVTYRDRSGYEATTTACNGFFLSGN